MEQIRIDSRDLRMRARHRRSRDLAADQASAPLTYAAPDGGPDIDEDLLARIDALLNLRPAAEVDDEDDA